MGDAFLWVMLSWLNGDVGAEAATVQMLSLHTQFFLLNFFLALILAVKSPLDTVLGLKTTTGL